MRISLVMAALSASLSAATLGVDSVATLGFLPEHYPAAPATLQSPSVKVWVNLSSRVYHCPGTRYYGTTKRGEFMTEASAEKTGKSSSVWTQLRVRSSGVGSAIDKQLRCNISFVDDDSEASCARLS